MTQHTNKSNTVPIKQIENILSPKYWFGEVDTRWLAIFRLLFGLLLLKDALYHLPLARIFYSDFGIITRNELFDGLVRDQRFSLMDSLGQPWMVILFFIAWIIVLILLIVGYRVRWMTILNFFMILSVHERNGYILTGADTLMRAMSFWLMFAPVGQHYALDTIRKRWQIANNNEPPQAIPQKSFALPVRMIQLQLILVYCSTAYLKTVGEIWTSGDTLHYITQIETFILPLGAWMRTWHPDILRFLSLNTLYIELLIPILLISPFFWRWTRTTAFFLAILLHGGIAITLSIQDFSILMLVCYVPFFAPSWMDWLEKQVSNWDISLSATIQHVLKRLTENYQPHDNQQRWWHLSDNQQKIFVSIILLPLLILVILWNIDQSVSLVDDDFSFPRPVEQVWNTVDDVVWYTGLWQFWDLFAPVPIQYDGWLIVEGQFEDGFSYDLFTEAPVDYDTPTRWWWGPQMKWEKFEENVYLGQYPALLRGWGSYYCRTLNENRVEGTRLATLTIIMVLRDFHAPDETPNESRQEILWNHWCFAEYAPN